MNPGKSNRGPEVKIHREFALQLGIAILGEIRAPAHSNAGDMVWLDRNRLLVGCGYRTNQAGIEQVHSLLAPSGVEVLSALLPYDSGPDTCLYLMSLMSMIDRAHRVGRPGLRARLWSG
jgi:N-dimethylarginine dimethylaminohydrolase